MKKKLKNTWNDKNEIRFSNLIMVSLMIELSQSDAIFIQELPVSRVATPTKNGAPEWDQFGMFPIAQEAAETKKKHDARTLFMRSKRLMAKQPKTLITDGLPSYSKACE